MKAKFKLTDEYKINPFGVKLFRIKATVDIEARGVKKGDKGGFTIALTLLGAVREFLGTGKIFNLSILPEEYGMLVFVLAPGAFIALGYLIALINSFKKAGRKREQIMEYILIICSFVTLLQMVMQAFVPALYATLGLFIPLIVVNCILLGRAEAFAAKNDPLASLFDGLGMGLGFTIALTLLGAIVTGKQIGRAHV